MLDLRIIAASGLIALVTCVSACTDNDTAISKTVQERIASEGVTEQLKVTTTRRVVVLEGVVSDMSELNRVEMAARNTPGIMGVDNRLVVQKHVETTGGALPATPTTATPARPAPAR